MIQQALKFHAEGLAVLPLVSKQLYLPWKEWQIERQTEQDVRILFNGIDNVNIACMHGAASNNTFDVDCDDSESFNAFASMLSYLGITTRVIRSNSTAEHAGGGRFLLRSPVPISTVKTNGWHFLGQGSYSVLHGTHPSGSIYTITDAPIFELPTLTAIPGIVLEPASLDTQEKSISRFAWKLLRGDISTLRHYESRSEAEMALCCSLLRSGFSEDDIISIMKYHEYPGKFSELFAQKPRHAYAYLKHTLKKASEKIATSGNDAKELAQKLKLHALSKPWPGRTGATDRAVFIAHCEIVIKCGYMPYGASCRELAELAGTSHKTATKATQRLVRQGLIKCETESTAIFSNRYSLVVTKGYSLSITNVSECNLMSQNEDAFRIQGLGKTGCNVYQSLLDSVEGMSIHALHLATGSSERTVRRKLNQMFTLGMVEPIGDGVWCAISGVDLQQIADELGTLGRLEYDKQKHFRDRRLHRTNLALSIMREK